VNTRSINERPYRPDKWPVAADPKLTPGTSLILILLFSGGLWGAIWLVARCVAVTIALIGPEIVGGNR
jgi:hypothetical protein